jgi:hypothetical protein
MLLNRRLLIKTAIMFVLTIREMMAQKGIKPSVFELFKRGIGRNSNKHYL